MKLAKINRFVSFVLAMVCCFGAISIPSAEEATPVLAAGSERTVRVGLCTDAPCHDARMFSSSIKSSDGFEIGTASKSAFAKSFTISNKNIIILPQVNANFKSSKVSASEKGNIGSYSAVVSSHATYSEAATAAKTAKGFVAIVKDGFEVRTNPSLSKEAVLKAVPDAKVASPVSGGLTILDANGKVLFMVETKSFALRSVGGGTVQIPVPHRSGNITNHDYQGFFEYSVDGSKLQLINVLGIEDYTKCVMANEIGFAFSKETRKAFSILARTVPMNHKHSAQGFDVCPNSACCQVYYGTYRQSDENNKIVDATKGLYCTYKGSPINVLYHNSNGGGSCSSVAAWGNTDVPYLKSAFVEEDGKTETWKHEYTKEEFYDYLRSRKAFRKLEDSDITMAILATDPYGSDYITVLSVTDGSGNTVRVENAEDVRSACGYKSANFDVEYTGDFEVLTSDGKVEEVSTIGVATSKGVEKFQGFGADYKTESGEKVGATKVVIDGKGTGHGVGFSSYGSEALVKDGYNYEYVLEFFFNGTEVTKY